MAQPGSLSALALDALGSYIYELCSTLTCTDTVRKKRKCTVSRNCVIFVSEDGVLFPAPKFKALSPKRKKFNFDRKEFASALKHIQDMIQEVPITVANELSNKLLDNIDNWDFEWGNHKDLQQGEILDEIITNVVHPAVTRIEPPQDHLDCSYLYPETVFCSDLIVGLIIKNIPSLKNLKALHMFLPRSKFDLSAVNFPERLTEFSGKCDNDGLNRIVESCKFLKVLNVFGSKGITNSSADTILKMTHLEKLNIAETKIRITGLRRLAGGLQVKSENILRYLAFSADSVNHLESFKLVPNLKLCVQLHNKNNLGESSLSELLSYRNLSGLQLNCSLNNLNTLLKEIGKDLVYLDAEVEYFGPINTDQNEIEKIEDVLEVGHFCSSLKCLHIEVKNYTFPSFRDGTEGLLPGFQTVRCLTLDVKDTPKQLDFLNFLFEQCSNVKKIMLTFDQRILKMYELISSCLVMGYMKKLEVIYFQPFCTSCELRLNGFTSVKCSLEPVKECVRLLITHCPHLRVIGGAPECCKTQLHNTQRLKFVPTWCQCKW